jgi:hypothetical protein
MVGALHVSWVAIGCITADKRSSALSYGGANEVSQAIAVPAGGRARRLRADSSPNSKSTESTARHRYRCATYQYVTLAH